MNTVKKINGEFHYTNQWHKIYGCKHATTIDCMWIWTDNELNAFQKGYDKKGEL